MTESIKFFWNGIRVNGDKKLIRCFYSIDNDARVKGPCVSLSVRGYSDDLPRDVFAVENDTDLYTDYFDTDRALLTPSHPIYKYARRAALQAATRGEPQYIEKLKANIGKPTDWYYKGRVAEIEGREARLRKNLEELERLPKGQPTAADLEAVREMNLAAESARLAEEEAERQRAQEKVLAQRNAGEVYITEVSKAHPIKPGEPVVKIPFSESPFFYAFDENLTLSVAAAEIVLKHYDELRHEENQRDGKVGYDKTDFVVEYTDEAGELRTYSGRYDLGDNDGGLIEHIRQFGQNFQECGSFGTGNPSDQDKEDGAQIIALADRLERYTEGGKIIRVSFAPWAKEAAQRAREAKEAEQEQARQDFRNVLDMVEMLTDDQLAAAVMNVPNDDPKKLDVARFFLQQLADRDPERALGVFREWKGGAGA